MKRRSFIKAGISLGGLGGFGSLGSIGLANLLNGVSSSAFAATNQEKISLQQTGPMVVVFLRGGADGLAMLSPLDDPNFQAARPPEMRFTVEKAAKAEGSDTAAMNLNGTNFYWHPAAGPLAKLYSQKRLIAWPAAGIKDETRSHFEAQEMMERGVHSLRTLPDPFGWMARQVFLNKQQIQASSATLNNLPLFAGCTTMPRAMQGANQVLAVRDLQGGVSFPGGPAGLRALQALGEADSNHPAAQVMVGTFSTLEQVNRALPKTDNKVLPYVSSGQTPYPGSDPGVGLRSIARLMQANVGLQYAWVDQGGWDTHDNQPGRINNQITQLSNALLAFDQDMKAQNNPYTLVVMTEFGRRLISNKSNGTDHGHGSLAMLMGSKIDGGKLLGRWPGLDTASLDRGADLAVTTDYLDILKLAQSSR